MEQLPLKDIHLPEPVGFWPPAPGWWLIAIVIPVSYLLLLYIYRRYKQKSVLKSAAKMLENIKNLENSDPLQTLAAISAWLRRVAISTAPRENVAGLQGSAWLAWLDAGLADAPFSQGMGRCLADAPYRQSVPADIDFNALFKICERWLKQQSRAQPRLSFLDTLRGKK